MTDRELMQQALEALLWEYGWGDPKKPQLAAITALRERLARQEQEPVAYAVYHRAGGGKSLHWPEQHSDDGDATAYQLVPLYTAPQPAQQALTDEQIKNIVREASKGSAIRRDGSTSHRIARAIEAAHGIIGEKK